MADRIARIFPRRTNATPNDKLAFVGGPPLYMFLPEIDRCEVSVTFTYDIPEGERLAEIWRKIAPTEVGGPAYGKPSGDFVPGRYLSVGNVITSRGCPNSCWFCLAARREGGIRELPITDGWRVHDDNLLATSREHQEKVFAMLKRQPEPAVFVGGFEAARLEAWHIEQLNTLRVGSITFAYDTPNDWEPLVAAHDLLHKCNWKFTGWTVRCYCLVGYPSDTLLQAEERVNRIISLDIIPRVMVYRDEAGHVPNPDFSKFARYFWWHRGGDKAKVIPEPADKNFVFFH